MNLHGKIKQEGDLKFRGDGIRTFLNRIRLAVLSYFKSLC